MVPKRPVSASPPPTIALPSHLSRLASVWESAVARPRRRLSLGVLVAIALGGAHLGRLGTPAARLSVLGLALGWAGAVAWLAARRARRENDAARTLSEVLASCDRDRADKALRAWRLRARAQVDETAGSSVLAEMHFDRSVRAISVETVRTVAETRGRRLSVLALLAAALAIAAVAAGPLRVVEGLDVLLARDGRAPLPLSYLDDVQIDAHPPDYLKAKEVRHRSGSRLELPYGSLLTMRGVRRTSGRQLFLRGGETEVPFVDDGAGALVARWTLKESATLRISARFGAVRIDEPGKLDVISIPDQAPVVEVEGAPRTVRLLEETEIPILYRAVDDHGLREVILVLRSGTAEERRLLSKLDGDTRRDQGGYQLRVTDRFVRASYLPVEVTVEARDNDPLTGPKWGKSPAILLVPPAIGEPEALRYEALVKAQTELVDLLARRLTSVSPKGPSATAFSAEELAAVMTTSAAVSRALDGTYGNLTVPRRLGKLAEGQLRKLTEAARKSAASRRWEPTAVAVESATLALDGGLRSLSSRDAQSAARRLSKVASLAADAFLAARATEEGQKARARADAALAVIEPSGRAIRRLGVLGGDLGSIVANDLKRIRRSLGRGDLLHAELAARDLAARLARPSPSFQGGGSGNGGGAEGGGGKPDPADQASGDAEDAMEAGEKAIDELAKDHAGNVSDVEQALAQAEGGDDADAFRDEAKRHASAVREAVRRLPRAGGDPSSASAAAATAREQAIAMAEALERGSLHEALETGKSSAQNLGEAARAGDATWDESTQREAREAGQKLGPEVAWAEQALEKMKKRLAERARVAPQKNREGELADRTRALSERGDRGEGALPGATLGHLREAESKMRDAQRDLAKGDVQRALDQQREAQRSLEAARSEKDDRDAEGKNDGDAKREGDGKDAAGGTAPIPKADEHKGPEEFRRRVLDGLSGGGSGRLRPAVKRYAEKLLR